MNQAHLQLYRGASAPPCAARRRQRRRPPLVPAAAAAGSSADARPPPPPSLMAQRLAHGSELLRRLRQPGGPTVEGVAELAAEAQAALCASRDWAQLAALFATAAAKCSATGGGGGGAGGQPQPQPPPWAWARFRRLEVHGLGSLAEYAGGGARAASPEGEAKRAGMRLYQLAAAGALRSLLPGLAAPTAFHDPSFSEFDLRLIQMLGGAPHARELLVVPSSSAASFGAAEPAASASTSGALPQGGGEPPPPPPPPTFLYMPCAPRELYDSALASRWSAQGLGDTAVWGTSFMSLSSTATLFDALQRGGGDSRGGGAGAPLPRVAAVVSRRAVLELFGPDCAAHGVGTSLHVFPPAAVAAAAGSLFVPPEP